MCVESGPPPSGRITRRGVLAGAAVLAGTAGLVACSKGDDPKGGDPKPGDPKPGADPAAPAGHLVVEGGTLLDPETGAVTEDAVVVIRDGAVTAAGKRGSVELPSDVPRLDAHGQWVLPGLVDAHIHLNTVDEARETVQKGATSARSGSTNFYQDIAVRELARQAPGQAPRMVAAGIFVTPNLGDSLLADPDLTSLARQKDGVRSEEALRQVIEVNLARGADVIKTRVNERAGLPDQDPLTQVYSREQLSWIVAAAKKAGKGVLCHSYSQQGCYDAVMAGIRSLEHGVFVDERTLNEMKSRGTYFTPTLTAITGMVGDKDPILDKRGRDFLPILKRAVLTAHQMGVPLAAGTDSSGGVVEPIGREVELMHEAGLSTLDAIRTATTSAAILLGLEKTVGRLEPGFSGDVLVVAGDPLNDVSVLKKPVHVVRAGLPV